MSAKVLILPVEIKARELPGKALLAVFAARAGFDVLIGDQRVIARSVHRLPRGIYLDKSVSRTKIQHYRRLRELGHFVAAWCEEGLVYRDKTAYQFERLSPISMSLLDAFFAWGEVHRADIVEAIPESRDKVHALGNPRFDLLRPLFTEMLEAEARRLRTEHGKFILVATTFSRFNRHQGQPDVVEVLKARGFELTGDQQAYYNRLVGHVGEVFRAFQTMVPEIARAYSDHTIIVRPHPSEDHDQWRRALAGIRNAKVIYQGSAEPWLWAASAVIHNASTTGVEAYLLQRPVISYMPAIDDIFNRRTHLPNMVSTQAYNVEELLRALGAAIECRPSLDAKASERKELVNRYIANASGPLAAERIVRVLSDLHDQRARAVRRDTLNYLNAWSRMTVRQFLSRLRQMARFDQSLQAYMNQKFPDLSLQELRDTLRAFSQSVGESALSVMPHCGLSGCYVISAALHEATKSRELQHGPAVTV